MASYRCKLCDVPRVFGDVSKLRKHQRADHAERWGGGKPAPTPNDMAALTGKARLSTPDPAPTSVRITHGRRVLEMALVGYRAEMDHLQAEIDEVEALLELAGAEPPDPPTTGG